MYLMLIICILFFLCQGGLGFTKVPICNGVQYTITVEPENSNAITKPYIEVGFNLTVEYNSDNQSYPNKLHFSNLYSNINIGNEQTKVSFIEIFDNYYFANYEKYNWNATLSTFDIPFTNNEIHLNAHLNTDGLSFETEGLFFKNGYIFDGLNGQFMDERHNFCIKQNGDDLQFFGFGVAYVNMKACCFKKEYIEILDSNTVEGQCTNFQNHITVVNYNLNNQSDNYFFEYQITENTLQIYPGLMASDSPFSYNILQLCTISNSKNCTIELPLHNDFQYEMFLEYSNWNGLIVGEIARRNGTFFSKNNIPYTTENPCWNNTSNMPIPGNDNDGRMKSSFCCTKFENMVTTETYESMFTTIQNIPNSTTIDNIVTTTLHSSGNHCILNMFLLIFTFITIVLKICK